MDIIESRQAWDAEVLFSDGSSRRLGDFWRAQATVLVFLRHFG